MGIKLRSVNKEILHTIRNIAKANCEKIFLVGGYVRDLILKRESNDLDFVIEGSAISFGRSLAEVLGVKSTKIRENIKYMSITIKYKNITITITPSRMDSYIDGKLKIVLCPLDKDYIRRDFTINALYLNLENMEILDFCDGLKDLKNKNIKYINKNAFEEDPTRIIRALRYKYELGFDIDKETEDSMVKSLHLIPFYSKSRLEVELKRTLNIKNIDYILKDRLFIDVLKELGYPLDLSSKLDDIDRSYKYLKIEDYIWIEIKNRYPDIKLTEILKPSKQVIKYMKDIGLIS